MGEKRPARDDGRGTRAVTAIVILRARSAEGISCTYEHEILRFAQDDINLSSVPTAATATVQSQ
jgi:hypothetical protein